MTNGDTTTKNGNGSTLGFESEKQKGLVILGLLVAGLVAFGK